MSKSEAEHYYFYDSKGREITSIRGPFSWQAYYFSHLNPYKFDKQSVKAEDIIHDSLGNRIRPNISYAIYADEIPIVVLQRKDDGKIWISSNWQYHIDCYSATLPFGEAIYAAIKEATGEDKEAYDKLTKRYEELIEVERRQFRRELERYFRSGKLKAKYWDGGYLFAASREWRIKTTDELNVALKVEDEHFCTILEEFIKWFRRHEFSFGDNAEEFLRKKMREMYVKFPWNAARDLGEDLVKEDGDQPSDTYLWWGGEPNADCCYAFLTLFFEIDPDDIGTSRFEEKVSKNLRTIINIAERSHWWLSFHREYTPYIWKAILS